MTRRPADPAHLPRRRVGRAPDAETALVDVLWHELAEAETSHDLEHAAHCWADLRARALVPEQRQPSSDAG